MIINKFNKFCLCRYQIPKARKYVVVVYACALLPVVSLFDFETNRLSSSKRFTRITLALVLQQHMTLVASGTAYIDFFVTAFAEGNSACGQTIVQATESL